MAKRNRDSLHADMNMPTSDQSGNPVGILAARTGREWEHLARARTETSTQIEKLKVDLKNLDNLDSSIVVFGSLARGEATHSSDIDWTLLIDGKADTQHLAMAQRIKGTIPAGKQPGVEGTFGNMAFSHQILHCIGGEEDSNANTTRRILLLLESTPIGNVDAWENVQKNILRRYIDEDQGLRSKTNTRGVPLFLLNDIARYWRIMVVDFAYKQRERANRGYALRSIKLGLSRKLIYISGDPSLFQRRCELSYPDRQLFQVDHPQPAIEHLRATFRRTPLEIIARILVNYEELLEPSRRLFDAYDRFLGMLADETQTDRATNRRKLLIEMLTLDEMEDDEVFQEARDNSK